MYEFRVTKYNPGYRDNRGAYTRDEWTAFGDIGQLVTKEEYLDTERKYIESALAFLREQEVSNLTIQYIENLQAYKEKEINLSVGEVLNHENIAQCLESILREKYWAKLESTDSFVHIGWDYCMYIGVTKKPKESIEFAKNKGLFVEEFKSPYTDNEL